MSNVPTPSKRAKRPASPDFNPPLKSPAWFQLLQEAYRDVAAAAEDQTRPPSQRALGRRGARDQLRSAGETVERMLAAALQG
jgi:hypothetical protein